MKPQLITIPLLIYPFDVAISINQSDRIFKKDISIYPTKDKELSVIIHDHQCAGISYCLNDNPVAIIRLHNNLSTPEHYGVLQHELLHITTQILEKLGIKFNPDNDEPFCYLLQYLTKQIYDKTLFKK